MNENFLGFGLGLRHQHIDYVVDNLPPIDWFEINSENFMVPGGKPKYYLHKIRQNYPVVMHGVSMSLGGSDPLNVDYLRNLRNLADEIEPEWLSDHLCWTTFGDINTHDLMPLPYTEEAITHVAERIRQVQDFLGRRILIENVSSYITYNQSHLDEWQFLNAVADNADCMILLDINNIYVSARNHGFDAIDYIDGVNEKRVKQFHLAGHSDYGDYVIDTHDDAVSDPIWDLYGAALSRFGLVSTMIERDDSIPPFPDLEAELDVAREIAHYIYPDACSTAMN